jgi:hypothetical protein
VFEDRRVVRKEDDNVVKKERRKAEVLPCLGRRFVTSGNGLRQGDCGWILSTAALRMDIVEIDN